MAGGPLYNELTGTRKIGKMLERDRLPGDDHPEVGFRRTSNTRDRQVPTRDESLRRLS